MRSYDELKWILELWEEGYTKKGIAFLTGIPRGTVRGCVARYGSLANFENLMAGKPLQLIDESGAVEMQRRYYVIPGHIATKRGYSDEDLVRAIADSVSYAEVLRKLNLRPAGSNYDLMKRRIKELGLDVSHIKGRGWALGKKSSFVRNRALEEILVENSTYVSTTHLRKRLIAEGIFQHRCISCGLLEWLERPIPLEIDHINGDRRDNRLDNLRLLCPNCHALTTTYRGKNKKGQ